MRKCFCSQWQSFVVHGERLCGDMSCEITAVDDLRTDPPTRKCSTSSTNSTNSTSSTSSTNSAGSMATSDGDLDAAAVAIPPSAVVVYVTDDAVSTMSVVGYRGDRTRATVANGDASSSDIHTDRDECSSDDSCNGPDSPTGLKRVGSVYDFGLDGGDSPPPCANHPFAAGPDADLTKVARKQLRMIREVDVAVCHLNHTNTIISKILSSKYLRRWENHQIRLQDDCITSNTPSGFLSKTIGYEAIKDLYPVKRWDSNFKYCLRVVVTNGSYLLQTTNQYLRDQILYSILWKKNVQETQTLLKSQSDPDDMLKELQNIVDFAKNIPLVDDEIFHMPTFIASTLMTRDQEKYCKQSWEKALIGTLRPLIEDCPPSAEMCSFLSHHCKDQSSLPIIKDSLVYTITRILKHNFDFARTLTARTLVQDYIKALYIQDQSGESIRYFLSRVHSASAVCPHNRVLPNMVSTCITAIYSASEELPVNCSEAEFDCYYTNHLRCYIVVLQNISEYSDWLYGLAQLLRPLPFPALLLIRSIFMEDISSVILKIGLHEDCEIHKQVLAVRETKDGWFDLCSPIEAVFCGSSIVWTQLLKTLMACERCKKKKLLKNLKAKHLGTCVSEALKNNKIVMDVLCLMLEWMVVEDLHQRNQIVDTLKSTEFGRKVYDEFMSRQNQLLELQRKGGPQNLSLPARGTDLDLNSMFDCGPFGNLESVDLAFTNVTDTCANTLIKLPSLKVLNLWGTQFGDSGLLIISDHLTNLQVLNLCETKVTDRGIVSLISLINLKKLNLNSTKATVRSVDVLKKKLPGLHEVDVRYSFAW
ncbi:C-Maf-inducing protein-like isoform X1 [Myzus persicae]|uniref:C-Maf-inducing protein-like isoform X1 n=2 Tax=Myzus persicae TaxID=13164 RepID=UPI000B938F72|nr:C-Maf-inducing protein-like isoform X1 [Myzus persicae]XP_022176890.1 C-Maf-inducing protein-like isoform X1 [Myzus persicae]XP_022176892.1 C-Maf-inducing protein-like isoform X1 [Myzus persicae]XP_022176893.1 C-Maf-inducing protein-like isoform X1 [Myzus persicae]